MALGLKALMGDLGLKTGITIKTDASAAKGIATRKGLGKVRHLDCTDLWIQDAIRSGRIALAKVPGADNPADILTKYVDRKMLDTALKRLSLVPTDGRAASAP